MAWGPGGVNGGQSEGSPSRWRRGGSVGGLADLGRAEGKDGGSQAAVGADAGGGVGERGAVFFRSGSASAAQRGPDGLVAVPRGEGVVDVAGGDSAGPPGERPQQKLAILHTITTVASRVLRSAALFLK
jgi:hypothetical protein